MKLASLNSKNNIDVIVNQFFRELPKRRMLLQNTTGKRRLEVSREKSYISYMAHYRTNSILTSKCTENARPTAKPGWGHLNKQLKKNYQGISQAYLLPIM